MTLTDLQSRLDVCSSLSPRSAETLVHNFSALDPFRKASDLVLAQL